MLDRMRYAAVRQLESLGFTWIDNGWRAPSSTPSVTGLSIEFLAVAGALHEELQGQIEDRAGCLEATDDLQDLVRLADLADAYQAGRPKV